MSRAACEDFGNVVSFDNILLTLGQEDIVC